jgi:signal peptidase I
MASDPQTLTQSVPRWQRVVIGRNPKRTLVRASILVVTCLIVFNFGLLPIRVEGPSMLPTYKDHGINFVNRLAYLSHEPQRGDVVAIRTSGYHNMFMKRIIGLPGETVEFHEGHVIIDGQVLDEPYVKTRCFWEAEPRTLGPFEFYCVGDNRSMAKSDHYEGKTERARIIGKVLL